ncbi:MAG TPA: helix-turn-helix domain-containing protein [Acidimicrobiales bacterium]|jgi:excisionase family DNA binding protein|nr:helix-turn-helix domain-containing protein [Acidimicrobiales bacterium]
MTTAARTGEVEEAGQVEYLTPGQVADLLHVSPKTVNRWADQGRIGCLVTLGGHRRFARTEVAAVMQTMASGSARRRRHQPDDNVT